MRAKSCGSAALERIPGSPSSILRSGTAEAVGGRRTQGRELTAASDDLYLEQLRPPFAGDEETVVGRIVGNAVEHVCAGALGGRQQPAEIDVAGDLPARGRDARNIIGLPDVRKDLAFDEFQLVQ